MNPQLKAIYIGESGLVISMAFEIVYENISSHEHSH